MLHSCDASALLKRSKLIVMHQVEVLRALDDGRVAADIRASEAKLRKELQVLE